MPTVHTRNRSLKTSLEDRPRGDRLRLQYAPLQNQGAVFAHRSVEATHDDWDFIQRYAATVTGARARRHVFAMAEEYQWRGNSHQARPLRLRVTATRGSDFQEASRIAGS